MSNLSAVSRGPACFRSMTSVAIGVTLFLTSTASAAIKPKEVDDSVDKAVAYLLSQQKNDGSWEAGPRPKQEATMLGPSPYALYGGETAIVTYALLAAGQNPQTPAIKKAIDWLSTTDLHGTYAVTLRSQVWNQLPESARTKQIMIARNRDRDFVLFSRIQKGPHSGLYGYTYGADAGGSLGGAMQPMDPKGPADSSWYDRSNSQYGVLGAWALEQAGAEIPTKYWEDEDLVWKKTQFNDGSWNYNDIAPEHKAASFNMTCAGLATLFITQDYIMRSNAHQFDVCKGGVANPNIEKGLAWMDKHFGGGMADGWYYYRMYGIERVGVASGRKFFGNLDWYQWGAEAIVRTQSPGGDWNKTLHDTAFSILFLVRGRAPVMMNKLLYVNTKVKQPEPWNERPRDAANLARWMGKRSLEGFLNWQIVNLQVPVEELHDAPILYITGSEELSLSPADTAKLRLFSEQGGMILGNADCGNALFAASFKKLGSTLFPKYEFRKLPPNHPIFSQQARAAKWKTMPLVEGMSNGVRELMVLLPQADSSRAWQTDSYKTREESFQLGGNIFLYATGKENLRHKGDTYIVMPEGPATRSISVARLQVGDNWDPEPAGWPRLSAMLHNDRHIDVKTEAIKLGTGDLARFKIAHLTGTTRLKLSDTQHAELKDFIEKGGTLVIDSAGGNADFADSAESELKLIFGDAVAKDLAAPLPPTHAVYTISKMDPIRYRLFARATLAGNQPRLRGLTIGGRIGVFYSREDLSAGLVGEQVDGIVGYDPQTAGQIMENILMIAEGGAK